MMHQLVENNSIVLYKLQKTGVAHGKMVIAVV